MTVVRRRQGRPQGGSEEIVRAVLAATLKQLGERGLEGLNIEEIATADAPASSASIACCSEPQPPETIKGTLSTLAALWIRSRS